MPVFTDYPTTKQTSLNDLLGSISGVQQFQQQQQLMPLALRKAQAETTLAEETLQPNISSKKSESEKLRLEAEKAGVDLNQHYANISRSAYGGLLTDPDFINGNSDKMVEKLNHAHKFLVQSGVPENRFSMRDDLVDLAKKNPKEAYQMLKNGIQQGQSVSTQGTQLNQAPSFVNQGNVITPVYTSPYQGATTNTNQQYQMGLPPGSIDTIDTDPVSGAKIVVTRNSQGQVIGSRPAAQPSQSGYTNIQPGETTSSIANMQDERTSAKLAAQGSASAINNIDTALKYLPLAQTGKYSEALSGLQSAFGNIAGSTKEELAASARDIVQKNIADLALQKNAALGGKFVASLEGAQNSLAEAGKNPTAIVKSLEQLRPLIQHAQYYQQGLENAIAKHGGDVQIKRKFDNEMIKTFDPQALMAYNAYQRGGKTGLDQFTKNMSATQKAQIFDNISKYSKLINGDV